MAERTRSAPQGGRHVRSRRALGVGVALVATLLALTVGAGRGDDTGGGTAAHLDRASGHLQFALHTFDGELLESDNLRGRPVVLNGYASWCALCEREMPDFERVHQDLGHRVTFIGVNPQSNDTDAAQARLVRSTGVSYPTVRDPDDQLIRLFSPTGGLPVTVFLDEDGIVREVHRGLLTEQMLRQRLIDVLGVRG